MTEKKITWCICNKLRQMNERRTYLAQTDPMHQKMQLELNALRAMKRRIIAAKLEAALPETEGEG